MLKYRQNEISVIDWRCPVTKTLQRKFIGTAMIAITVLLVVLLGTINVINAVRISRENEDVLEMLTRSEEMRAAEPFTMDEEPAEAQTPPADGEPVEVQESPAEMPPGGASGETQEPPGLWQKNGEPIGNRRGGFLHPNLREDDVRASRYFTAYISTAGEILRTDVSNISSVDEDSAKDYAKKAVAQESETGRISHFKYRISDKPGDETLIVFLDVSRNSRSILAVLFISVGIGFAAELLMLLLVILLSRKAIRPIAENMERQKQFVTDAGHEIKTPLAIILANTDAMELHNGETKWSKNIRTQTNRLSGLMKDLLTLARTDEGSVNVAMADCDLSAVVTETVHAFKEPAKLKGITIEKEITEGLNLYASKEQMIQLVSLLMDNAVKYSPENETIRVRLYTSGKGIKLKVSNACDNMDEETVGKLFDRFYRGDTARTQKNGGYGIGLSVARAICEGHRGSIKADYENKRITFTAVLNGGKRDKNDGVGKEKPDEKRKKSEE